MSEFRRESKYDKEIGDMVNTYFVDNEEVCEDDFYELMDLEVEEAEQEDECTENCTECPICEYTDEDLEIGKILYEYTHKIINSNSCPNCIFDILQELANKFRDIGFEDCKAMVKDFVNLLD
jgi:hypothetical protein